VARDKKALRRPRLAFTEWNCRDVSHAEMSRQWQPTDTQYRMVDALAVAGFVNAMQRQCRIVGLANCAQSINVVGLLLVTPEHVVRETVYWALTMQRHHSGPTAVDTWVDCDGYSTAFEGRDVDVPYLDVGATMDQTDGRLFVSIVNRHRTEEAVTQVRLRDALTSKTGRIHRLWHEDPMARNTISEPEAIVPRTTEMELAGPEFHIALPPHSYSILELILKG